MSICADINGKDEVDTKTVCKRTVKARFLSAPRLLVDSVNGRIAVIEDLIPLNAAARRHLLTNMPRFAVSAHCTAPRANLIQDTFFPHNGKSTAWSLLPGVRTSISSLLREDETSSFIIIYCTDDDTEQTILQELKTEIGRHLAKYRIMGKQVAFNVEIPESEPEMRNSHPYGDIERSQWTIGGAKEKVFNFTVDGGIRSLIIYHEKKLVPYHIVKGVMSLLAEDHSERILVHNMIAVM